MKKKIIKSLYLQLIIIIIVLALIPLLAFSLIGYKAFNDVLFEKISESTLQTVDQMSSYSSTVYQDMNDILTKISIHSQIQRILKEETADDWAAYSDARLFTEFTNLLMVGNPEIVRISIDNHHGKRLDSEGHFLPDSEAHISFEELNEKLQTEFIATGSIYYRNGEILTFGKKVNDLTNGKTIGTVMLDLNLSIIAKEFDKTRLLKSGFLMLVNQNNEILYHPKLAAGTTITKEDFPIEQEKNYELSVDENGKRHLYLMSNVPNTGWKLYGEVPYDEVVERLKPLRYGFVFFVILISLSIIVLSIFIKKLFVTPIKKLKDKMERVQHGDFGTRVHFSRDDEIGSLGANFNDMVEKIEELIERVYQSELKESKSLLLQKQAEINALQEKITPHFLYNTLNTISWFANRRGIREIQIVVDSLSRLLRYSLQSDSKFVTLKEEFSYLKLYSEIIDFRFEGEINFNYELPQDFEDILVPRLLIQPLVENAVKHAFNEENKEKQIKVCVQKKEEDLVINIIDNGSGIGEDEIFKINKRLKGSSEMPMNESIHASEGGLGIVNVHQRIQLTYGERYGLKLFDNPGKGSTFSLYLPLQPLESE